MRRGLQSCRIIHDWHAITFHPILNNTSQISDVCATLRCFATQVFSASEVAINNFLLKVINWLFAWFSLCRNHRHVVITRFNFIFEARIPCFKRSSIRLYFAQFGHFIWRTIDRYSAPSTLGSHELQYNIVHSCLCWGHFWSSAARETIRSWAIDFRLWEVVDAVWYSKERTILSLFCAPWV